MVDRIVPATTDADRARIAAALDLVDAAPVVAEGFFQWVIEDCFPLGRPDWSLAGASFVADARPWETVKLRLLNGAHSSLAWTGLLAGHETVADAMADPALAAFIERLMRDEIAPTLTPPPGCDLPAYIDALLARFRNPHLRHRLAQIASDGSQKLPQRLVPTIEVRLAAGLPLPLLARTVAAFLRCVQGRDDAGRPLAIVDPGAEALARAARAAGDDAAALARLCRREAAFGARLAGDARFGEAVADVLRRVAASPPRDNRV
jgi:fructuronate reductase